MNSPSVAIVILNWNGKHYLEKFLPSVLSSTWPNKQVIVADNGSTDDSVAFVRSAFPEVRIIDNGANEGFARGYNSVMAKVEADYAILLNSDVEVEPAWIEPLVKCMESDVRVGACQPKLMDWANRTRFEYAGGAGGWLDSFGYPFCRGRIFDVCEDDKGQYDREMAVFWASGAALCIRPGLFRQLGGFDPYFFAHQEEIDFCWRLQLAGYTVMACPSSVVYHVGGGTLPKGNQRKVFLNFRNNLIMLSKNLSWQEKLWKLPLRIMLDAVSAWKNLLIGQTPYFTAVMHAHLSWVLWILFHRGESLFPINRTGKLRGLYTGNIAWEHFAKGKKRFSEIVRVLS